MQKFPKGKYLFFGLGVLLIVLFQLQRAPGIYSGLWSDEVCYNQGTLSAKNGLWGLSKQVCVFFKPVVDFAIKKWFWFKLLPVTEAGFSLIPWFYAAVTLLLILFAPWTPLIELRLLGVLLVGLCGLEAQYSVEAEGYSLTSLISWINIFGLGWSLKELYRRHFKSSFWIYLIGLLVGLNGHFFAWPFLMTSSLIYMFLFLRESPPEARKESAVQLLIGNVAMAGTTLMINIYPFYNMVVNAPASNESFVLKWQLAWQKVRSFYSLLGVPYPFFLILALIGLFHPAKTKRILNWILAAAAGPCMYFLILMFLARSSYPLPDRYLLSYLAPLFLLLFLGIESAILWVRRFSPSFGRVASVAGVLLIGFFLRTQIKQVPAEARLGWTMMRSTPMNYSARYEFFEKVKSFQKPALVLCNQSWLSVIPDLYMKYIGAKPTIGSDVLNVAGYETPQIKLIQGIARFLTAYGEEGLVVIYQGKNLTGPVPCDEPIPQLVYSKLLSEEDACIAIYESKNIGAWVRQRYIPAQGTEGLSEIKKGNLFLKETMAPLVFYLVPTFLLAILFYAARRPLQGPAVR